MLDLYKIIAFINIYHEPLFGVRCVNVDHGKDNLESYFVRKLGWSRNRLDKAIKILRDNDILRKEKADVPNLFSLSIIYKTFLEIYLAESTE